MTWISKILDVLQAKPQPMVLTDNNIQGLLMGGAVGEALGVPVVSKTPADLSRNPVSDMLGFGDYQTPAGTFSYSGQAMIDFVKYLIDNHNGGYTVGRLFSLCNSWYLYKAKDEEQRLRVMLPCAAVAGLVYSRMRLDINQVLESLPDFVCDSGVVHSSLVFYVAMHISMGYPLSDAVSRARNQASALCKRIGIVIEGHNESLQVVYSIMDCVSASNDFRESMLAIVNKGIYPDLTGNVCGILLGLFYGLENIPYLWRNNIKDFEQMPGLSAGLINILR